MTVGWTCPACGRPFGRAGQSHECAPAMSMEEYLATAPAFERPIVEAVLAHLDTLGAVVLDPVSVGLFIRTPAGGKVSELRPLSKWEAMWFPSVRRLTDRRITRKPYAQANGWWYVANLRTADDVDDTVRDWLTEAYESAAG